MHQPTFSDEAAQELQDLAEQWQYIINESDRWFTKYAQPLFAQCRTMDEWKRVRGGIPSPVGKDGQFIELPGNIEIHFAYSTDSIKYRS